MGAKMSDILQLRDVEVRQVTYRDRHRPTLQSAGSDVFLPNYEQIKTVPENVCICNLLFSLQFLWPVENVRFS